MSLVEQWREIVRGLPEGWSQAYVRLTIADETKSERAAALLGPLNPGRHANVLTFQAAKLGLGASPALVERLLKLLDEERLHGELVLAGTEQAILEPSVAIDHPELAAAWDESVEGLPPDWSDIYALVEFVSTDWLERAALLMAPVNPARFGAERNLRFRVAQRSGYGASPGMTRRCLERVDAEKIRGELRILRVLSDTDPVHTQGPVWYVEGHSV